MEPIPFDDVDAINAAASDEFGPWSEPIRITQQMIDDFADLTGDHQWIHVDVERCERESPFGGPIAHGFLTMSLLPRLMTFPVAITGHANIVNYGCDGARFLSPVPAGSSVHGRSRLVGAEARGSGTLVKVQAAVHVVGAERPSLLYTSLSLFQG